MVSSVRERVPLVALRALALLAAIAFFVAPAVADSNALKVLTEFLTLLVMALMWNLLVGYADIMTVGQHAFVGVGAYAFYAASVVGGWNPFACIVVAGVAALVVAVPALGIIFRLRAAYLAVGTWVVAEVLMLGAGKLPGFGGGAGTSLPIDVAFAFGRGAVARYQAFYWLALALAALTAVSTYLLLRSRIGLGLTAMRDDEEAAGSVGVDLVRARTLCFLWAAPFLGMAGALVALQTLRIAPDASFSITDWTVDVIFIVIIGGIGSLEGPVLGTLLFFVLRQYLGGYGTWYQIVLGALSIAVILIEPRGLWGLLRRVVGGDVVPLAHVPPRATGAGSLARP